MAVIITFGFLYYTQLLVHELQLQSREFQNFKARIFEENINKEEITNLTFFFSQIIQTADYPIIYTDPDFRPQFWKNVAVPEVSIDSLSDRQLKKLERLVSEFRELNPPIPISYQNAIVLGYYIYGESLIINKLRWLPFIEIFVVAMFILIGYAGFRSIKKSEERFIWVGMAKETAHQLGTPLSAQIGWLEYLKASPQSLNKVLPELEKDLTRLQVITNRFSQIGSRPDIKPENVFEIIGETVQYFNRRIPRKKNKTEIISRLDPEITAVKLNPDLFSWVLENLIKNALDAMENKGGTILISSGRLKEGQMFIDVQDSGKGIPPSARKNIFNAGFSSKPRGWGLGLSLAKRIIQDYHGGKIFLKESQVGEGTTFRIVLQTE